MTISKTSTTNGIIVGLLLILYFLLIKSLGLLEVYWLRLLNGVILVAGIYRTIKKCKEIGNNHVDYFTGFSSGIRTGLIATVMFVLFLSVYLYHINPNFSETLMSNIGWTIRNPERILLTTIFIEGISSTMIFSLTLMQYFKTSWNLSN